MRYIITNEENGILLRDFLRKQKISSSLIKRLKRLPNGILVNSVHQTVRYVLKENDILELQIDDFEHDTNKYLNPIDLPIEIIYEDENLTVVNKPSGMPTHQSINNHDNTLANALMFKYKDKPYVFRASNRLDKDTSGIVITANNRYYSSLVSNKIKKGEVSKEYIAVVNGGIDGEGVIDAPIDRIGKSIIKRSVSQNGEEAITNYKVLLSNDLASVLLVTPKTGRTHQIRVHMSHIGHPIIGDVLYFEESPYIQRQALHCLRMRVNEIGEFYAPIPDDMVSLIKKYFGKIDLNL